MKSSQTLRDMNITNCPCKDCGDRHLNCHSECKKYKNWVAEKEKLRDKIRKNESIAWIAYNPYTRRKRCE